MGINSFFPISCSWHARVNYKKNENMQKKNISKTTGSRFFRLMNLLFLRLLYFRKKARIKLDILIFIIRLLIIEQEVGEKNDKLNSP